METTKQMESHKAVLEAITTGKFSNIVQGTYNSLVNRIRSNGFFEESFTGKYPGSFSRSVGAFAIALRETGDKTRAVAVLSYVLDYIIQKGLLDVPHVFYNNHDPAEMLDQLDGTCHVLLAYAQLAQEEENKIFADRYYTWCRQRIVRSFRAPYFLDGNPEPDVCEAEEILCDGTEPMEEALCLAHNLFFEHTREYKMWNCCDMLTATFLGAAGEAMETLARMREDVLLAQWLAIRITALKRGIDRNLTYEDPEYGRIYGEMRVNVENSHGEIFPALGWPLLAPIAIHWSGLDTDMYSRTLKTLCSRTAIKNPVSGKRILMEEYQPGGCIFPENYGKIMAWQMEYLWQAGENDALLSMIQFIEENTTGNIMPEKFEPVLPNGNHLVHLGETLFNGELPNNTIWYSEDVGNGEQCVWLWLVAERMRKG